MEDFLLDNIETLYEIRTYLPFVGVIVASVTLLHKTESNKLKTIYSIINLTIVVLILTSVHYTNNYENGDIMPHKTSKLVALTKKQNTKISTDLWISKEKQLYDDHIELYHNIKKINVSKDGKYLNLEYKFSPEEIDKIVKKFIGDNKFKSVEELNRYTHNYFTYDATSTFELDEAIDMKVAKCLEMAIIQKYVLDTMGVENKIEIKEVVTDTEYGEIPILHATNHILRHGETDIILDPTEGTVAVD